MEEIKNMTSRIIESFGECIEGTQQSFNNTLGDELRGCAKKLALCFIERNIGDTLTAGFSLCKAITEYAFTLERGELPK